MQVLEFKVIKVEIIFEFENYFQDYSISFQFVGYFGIGGFSFFFSEFSEVLNCLYLNLIFLDSYREGILCQLSL